MNKIDLTREVRMILQRRTISSEEKAFLFGLFKHHPEWGWYEERKPKDIYTDKADHGTTCFYIQFEDGSHSSISYIKCIKNINPNINK